MCWEEHMAWSHRASQVTMSCMGRAIYSFGGVSEALFSWPFGWPKCLGKHVVRCIVRKTRCFCDRSRLLMPRGN